MSENDVKRAVLDNFKDLGIRAHRLNRGSFRKHGVWLKFGFDGMPDIIAFPYRDGRVLWIETKDVDEKNGLSEEQQKFREFCISRKIPHVTARSWGDVLKYLQGDGVTQ